MTETLGPGSLVLTKIKGFPPWPSMILPDEVAPQNILLKKPKSGLSMSKLKREYKKAAQLSAQEIEILSKSYLVKFFHDDTYQWVHGVELTPLPQEKLDSMRPKRMTKSLQKAFAIAKNAPSLAVFATYGSYGPPKVTTAPVETPKEEHVTEEVREDNDTYSTVQDVAAANMKKPKVTGRSNEGNTRKRRAATGKSVVLKKPKKKEVINVDEESEGHEVIDVESVQSDDDVGDIISPETFKKEEDDIAALERKYNQLVNELASEEYGDTTGNQPNASEWSDLVRQQTDILLDARRKLASQVFKQPKDLDTETLNQVAKTLQNQFRGRAPTLSVVNRVRIGHVLGALLKRSDVGLSNWGATRKALAEAYVRMYLAAGTVPVPLSQENYVM